MAVFELLTDRYDGAQMAISGDKIAGNYANEQQMHGFWFGSSSPDEAQVMVYRAEKVRAAKIPTQTWAIGQPLYWDATAKKVHTTATGRRLIGFALEALGSGTTSGEMTFDGFAGFLKA